MRSPFTIWSDDGRVDYGVERPKFPRAKRFGVAVVAFAVAGLGVWNAYSAIVANLKVRDSSDVREAANRQAESHDPAAEANREAANRPADANREGANRPADANREETARSAGNEASAVNAGRPTTRSFAARTRVKPHTLGLVPLGAPDRSAIAESPRVAAAEANSVTAPVDESTQVPAARSDHSSVKPEEDKLREKSRVAKRKPARGSTTIQVYDLPDGRRLVVGPVKNDRGRVGGTDFGRAGGTDFDGRDDLAPVPRAGPRIRVAWPWFFGMPF